MSAGWRRLLHTMLLTALLLPGFASQAAGAAPGHVVHSWTSDRFGFTISYRRDAFTFAAEHSSSSGETLVLHSRAGSAMIEARESDESVDNCAVDGLDLALANATSHEVVLAVEAGSTRAIAEEPGDDGAPRSITHRVTCERPDNGDLLIRYTHSAETPHFGRFESAARAIQASYRETNESRLLESTLVHLEPSVDPPSNSNLVNHPTRFFRVEIAFHNAGSLPLEFDDTRIMIPGIGTALESSWSVAGVATPAPLPLIEPGETAIGQFLFAVPETHTRATFCVQHVTNSDCTFLFDIRFDAPGTRPDAHVPFDPRW